MKRSQNPTYYLPNLTRQPRALLPVPSPLAASIHRTEMLLQVQSFFFFLHARVFLSFWGFFFFFFLNLEFFVFHGQIDLVVFSDQFFLWLKLLLMGGSDGWLVAWFLDCLIACSLLIWSATTAVHIRTLCVVGLCSKLVGISTSD